MKSGTVQELGVGHGHSNLADSAYLSKHSGTAWNGLRFFYFPSDDKPLRPGSASAPLRGRVVPPPAASRRRPEAGTRASPTPVLRYGAARAAGGLP